MIQQTLWFERKFNFDFPVGMFPVLLERLRGTVPRLTALCSNISDESLSIKLNGKWSIKEIAGHLNDLERLHKGRVEDYVSGKEILRAADLTNQATEKANHNSKSINVLIDSFNTSRNEFIESLEKLPDELIERSAVHPRLNQPMRLVDMVYFVCEHDDHELAKMRAIKKSL